MTSLEEDSGTIVPDMAREGSAGKGEEEGRERLAMGVGLAVGVQRRAVGLAAQNNVPGSVGLEGILRRAGPRRGRAIGRI